MLQDMTNDPLMLNRADGTTQDFRGLITKGKVITFDSNLQVSEGDIVSRDLPSGHRESYEIIDTGFHSGLHSIPASYQMTVRKVTNVSKHKPTTPSIPQVTNIYNVHGPNARINQQSVDNSHNVVGVGEQELFDRLKDAISQATTGQEAVRLNEAVEAMRENVGQECFSSKFQSFMALAANVTTVVTPFLPALAALAASAHGH